MAKVLEMVGASSREEFVRHYEAAIADALSRGMLKRERHWTEAIAVGNEGYVREIAGQITGRMRLKVAASDDGSWAVRDPEKSYGRSGHRSYGRFSALKIERKAGFWVLNRA